MLLSDLCVSESAVIVTVNVSDKKTLKRLSDLGVIAGAEIILEGGSLRRKFFVLSVGGKIIGISIDIANAIFVRKVR